MHVNQIMTRDVTVIPPDISLRDAARKMKELDVGILPAAENDRLIGMITDRDITVRAVAEGRDPNTPRVADAMSPRILYCFDDQDVEEAAQIMESEQIRRLPVVDRDKRLVGIISLGDIATRGQYQHLAGEVAKEVCQPGPAH